MPRFPNEFIKYLHDLGHILEPVQENRTAGSNLECTTCGTIFTIDGGWHQDHAWYEWYGSASNGAGPELYYYERTKYPGDWHNYPDLTCEEICIREIIK